MKLFVLFEIETNFLSNHTLLTLKIKETYSGNEQITLLSSYLKNNITNNKDTVKSKCCNNVTV